MLAVSILVQQRIFPVSTSPTVVKSRRLRAHTAAWPDMLRAHERHTRVTAAEQPQTASCDFYNGDATLTWTFMPIRSRLRSSSQTARASPSAPPGCAGLLRVLACGRAAWPLAGVLAAADGHRAWRWPWPIPTCPTSPTCPTTGPSCRCGCLLGRRRADRRVRRRAAQPDADRRHSRRS